MPAQLVRLDSPAAPSDQPASHSRWSPARVYPDPSSIPPHWYVYPAHQQQPRDPRPPLPPGSLPPTSPTQQPPWSPAYLPGGYARLMQVHPFVSMPPPPIPHKVWILDCKACGTFLTNRGMKAVLLLRPNVPLYSTDALPINCSAFSSPSDVPSHAPSSSISSNGSLSSSGTRSARSSISGPSSGEIAGAPLHPAQGPHGRGGGPGTSPVEHPPSRTCECLTQTLCCHGCGGAVGYMIVAPCQRCTSSITANNRATNGHRFVFYSSEITAAERHYVPGERGVSPFHPPSPTHAAAAQGGQAGLAELQIGAGGGTPPARPERLEHPSPAPSMPSLVSSPVAAAAVPRRTRRISLNRIQTAAPDTLSSLESEPVSPSPATLSPSALAARSRQSSAVQTQGPLQASSTSTSTSTGTRRLSEALHTTPPAPPNSQTTSPHLAGTPTFADVIPAAAGTASRARAASASAAVTPSSSSSSSTASTPLTFAHPPAPALPRFATRYAYPSYPPTHLPTSTSPSPSMHAHAHTHTHTQMHPQPSRLEPPGLPAEPLKAGEVLYWHHLLRSGEIPAVEEDGRARMDAEGQARAEEEEERRWERGAKGRVPVMRGLVAGR